LITESQHKFWKEVSEEEGLKKQGIAGKTKCGRILPNCIIQKKWHTAARHRSDCRKKAGEVMSWKWAEQPQKKQGRR
jgi:hypothetical protein